MASVIQMREGSKLIAELIEKHQASSSREGKGKRLWKKVKYQLVEYHSLPGFLKDNEYILGQYRAEWSRHLIGFFLFRSLTIYTAMKVPKFVDFHSLQLQEVLKADLHKLQECLPSLPNMPDLQKFREELKATFPSMDLLPSLSGWRVMELLYNCLPERFSRRNQIDVSVLGTRIPERWMPGKFDIAGHSQQLFHVLVVAGAYTHYRAGLVYLKWRDLEGC